MGRSASCPACMGPADVSNAGNYTLVDCEVCGPMYVDPRLIRARTQLDDWSGPRCAAYELRERFSHPATIHFNGSVSVTDEYEKEIWISNFPTTISERANKLLAALIRRSEFYGEWITIEEKDFPLAYVDSPDQFRPYFGLLEERGFISADGWDGSQTSVKVTAKGFEALESVSLLPGLTVFLSSTCHDLRDCRSEVSIHLESLGCIVRASDDPLNFTVSPTDDSIQSCLQNVQSSDVVFCLIDQRYGPLLKSGDYSGISATHAEIKFARKNKVNVFFFIRKDAFSDWSMLKRDPSTKTSWVEPYDDKKRESWTQFVTEYATMSGEEGTSNWFTQFHSVVDLKKLLTARVRDLNAQR